MPDKEKKEEKEEEFTSKQIVEGMRFLQQGITQVTQTLKGIQDGTVKLPGSEKPKETEKPKEEGAPVSAKDLEAMDRTEFMSHMLGQMKTDLIEPLTEHIKGISTRAETRVAASDISEAEKDEPDFWEYEDEMTKLGKEHPGLSVSQLLALAKSENPDKVTKLTEARKAEAKKVEEKEEETKEPEFGGLLPTSGVVVASEKLSPADAAGKAFDELGLGENLTAAEQ